MREQDAGIDHHQLATGLVYAQYGDKGGVQYRAKRNHIPLNQYLAGHYITKPQHHVGQRIYKLYITSSHLHNPVQMSYADMAGGLKEYEKKFMINQEYIAAIMSVRGGIIRDTIFRVCCDSLPAKRGKMDDLRQGLDDLIRHFKEKSKSTNRFLLTQ